MTRRPMPPPAPPPRSPAAAPEAARLKVFVSYSRVDSRIAAEIRAGSVGTLRSGGTFQGVALTGGAHLPVAFAISAVIDLSSSS